MDSKNIKKHFAHVIESLNESLLITDQGGLIVYANSSAADMLGAARKDLIGKTYADLVSKIIDSFGCELAYEDTPINKALTTTQPVCSSELTIELINGSKKTLINNSMPLHDAKGHIYGVISSFTDITEHIEQIRLGNALSDINASIGSTLEFNEVMNRIAKLATNAIGCEATSVVLREKDGWYLRYAHGATEKFIGIKLPNRIISSISKIFGLTEPIVINDLSSEQHLGFRLLNMFAVKSFVSIPIITRGETIGMVSFTFHTKPVGFSSHQIDFAKKLAVAVSLAMENVNLYADQRQARALSDLLNEIHMEISSTLNIDEMLDRISSKAARSIGIESAALIIVEDGKWNVRYTYNLPESLSGAKLESQDISYANLTQSKQPLIISDAYKDKRLNLEMIQQNRIRSLTIIPLIVKKEVIGALSFHYHSAPMALSSHQVDFVKKLGASLSLAIDNSNLYEDQRQTAILSGALNDLHMEISSTLDFEEIMNKVVVKASEVLNAESASVDILEAGLWAIRFIHGMPKELIGIKMSDSDAAHAAIAYQTRQPVVVSDTYTDTRLNLELVKQFQIKSLLTIPLTVRNEVIGALSFHYHTKPVTFSRHQVDFARKLSSTLALVIENSKIYGTTRHTADVLQEALLMVPRAISGIEFRYLYESARNESFVGGDFYDLYELEHGFIGIMTGDVSGKGLEAATFTSLLKNTIKAYAHEDKSTGKVMSKTNDVIFKSSGSSTFATAFFGILDKKNGTLNCCNGGHPPAILLKSDGSVQLLGDHNQAIGMFDSKNFTEQTVSLDPEDVLFLYTDGITEARKGMEFFGEARLINILKELKGSTARKLPKLVYDRVMEFTGGHQSDDIAILTVSLSE